VADPRLTVAGPEEDRPTFYFDFYSPYSYLAAERVNHVLPVVPRWQPVAFGAVLKETGRVPWSLDERREEGMRECEERALARGLPPLRWPPGWPRESYSLLPVRAAIFAKRTGRVVAFSLACMRQVFAGGKRMDDPDNVVIAAAACELHPRAVLTAIESRSVKDEARAATDAALARGLRGVPTVRVGDRLFWGDDSLEEAAEAMS